MALQVEDVHHALDDQLDVGRLVVMQDAQTLLDQQLRQLGELFCVRAALRRATGVAPKLTSGSSTRLI